MTDNDNNGLTLENMTDGDNNEDSKNGGGC